MVLLALAAFLAPLLGGQLPNDVLALPPDFGSAVQAALSGAELATLQHALIAMLIVGAFAYLVITRKIVQVPHAAISGPVAALLVLLLASVFMSDYRWTSQTTLSEWVVYGVALLACVAGLGRRTGPVAVLGALSAGTGILALLGFREYLVEFRNGNPSWRIFGTWNNPNALAGMLAIGVIVSLVLAATSQNRSARILAGASGAFSLLGAVLTGSKGGLLALEIGLVALFFIANVFAPQRRNVLGPLIVALIAGAGFGLFGLKGSFAGLAVGLLGLAVLAVLALTRGQRTAVTSWAVVIAVGVAMVGGFAVLGAGKGAGARVATGSATQEQSSGFRVQLYKGALSLIKRYPVGQGVGTYAFYSAQPGTTTRTELAHSTWLQLAVEGGVLAPLALLLALLAWFVQTFRSTASLPPEQNLLRAGTMAAVASLAVHGVLESNSYYFGLGLVLFLLMGVGIQLSADAGAPEFVAPPIRIVTVAFAGLCLGQLLFAGYIGKLQANLRWMIQAQDSGAPAAAESLKSLAPFDGETWYRSGYTARSLEEAERDFAKAAEVAPSPKYLRRLAQVQALNRHPVEAESSLKKALVLDKNNLQTLLQLMKLQDAQGNQEAARATAHRLLNVESTPYYTVRSLPEIVPTETLEARLYLAKYENPEKLLREAVEGFLAFAHTTVPYVRSMGWSVAGVDQQDAVNKTKLGLAAAKDLRAQYAAKSDESGVAWAGDAAAQLDSVLRELQPKGE